MNLEIEMDTEFNKHKMTPSYSCIFHYILMTKSLVSNCHFKCIKHYIDGVMLMDAQYQ